MVGANPVDEFVKSLSSVFRRRIVLFVIRTHISKRFIGLLVVERRIVEFDNRFLISFDLRLGWLRHHWGERKQRSRTKQGCGKRYDVGSLHLTILQICK